MFHLSKIRHTLHLHPQLLDLPLIDAIKGELEIQFLDKVIANLGLCISVYDILSIDGGFIFPGDGCASYEVIIRLVMFRPFVGEILCGKIEESNNDGLRCDVLEAQILSLNQKDLYLIHVLLLKALHDFEQKAASIRHHYGGNLPYPYGVCLLVS